MGQQSPPAAHGVAVFAIAIAGLFVTVFAMARNWRLARLLIFLGMAAILISLLVDAPQGLREGSVAIDYQGAKAILLGGFWVQLCSAITLAFVGPLLAAQLRSERAARRPHRAPGARRARRRDLPSARAAQLAALRAPPRELRPPAPLGAASRRPERLLPFACVAAATALFASELMTTFQFILPAARRSVPSRPPTVTTSRSACSPSSPSARSSWRCSRPPKPAAIAVAVAGLVALLLFLIVDLPDANSVGALADSCTSIPGQSFFDAKAVPQSGFWLEMASALALALSGAALATLTPDQLATLRPGRLRGPKDTAGPQPPPATTTPLPNPGSTPAGRNPAGSGGSVDAPADRPARARRGQGPAALGESQRTEDEPNHQGEAGRARCHLTPL